MNERTTWQDSETGCTVTRWTNHASNHLYFTNPGWFDGGRQLLITSDRGQSHTLASIDLHTGDQRPMTDPAHSVSAHQTCVDPIHNRAFTWVEHDLIMVDLVTTRSRVIHSIPPGWDGVICNVTADGRRVCFGQVESRGNRGFAQMFAARPTTRILLHDLETSQTRTLHERDVWMGHVNTSPTDANLISFCHEGPWTKVENRVWCCDLRDGRVWKIHPTTGPNECVGHEYWLADGRRIAYHGFNTEAVPVLGIVDVHTGQTIEFHQPIKTRHTHSLDGQLIVGDGNEKLPYILAWRLQPDGLHGPWKVCRHSGGWSTQRRHVHPRIAPDGRTVLFTSDVDGDPKVFSVELPDHIEDLPAVN